MSTPTTKVLMSAGNPAGRKLQELLAEITEDLHVKNDALEADPSPTSKAVRINNLGIIDCLALARVRQLDTLRRLNLIGPDRGPGGPPRIGAGAADVSAAPAASLPQSVDPAFGVPSGPTAAAPTVTSGPDLIAPAPAIAPAT